MKSSQIILISVLLVGLIAASGCIGNQPEGSLDENKLEELEEIEAPSLEKALPEEYTEEDIKWIGSCQKLQDMEENSTIVYALESDIDCSETDEWNDGEGFKPIGNRKKRFKGFFLGRGHNITNLYIERPLSEYVGLFGFIAEGSIIKNVGVFDANIEGMNYVGGLAGNNDGTISNTYVIGKVSGEDTIGGLVGHNSYYTSGFISESYSAGKVTGENNIGGLVGQNSGVQGLISNSYSTCGAKGKEDVGGLVGWNSANISDSYATGDVKEKEDGFFESHNIGGLAGWNTGNISISYANGDVTGHNGVGGLVGQNEGIISKSHSNGHVTGFWSVGGLAGKNSEGGVVSSSGKILSSYATGNVSGNESVGGLVGTNNGEILESYSIGKISGKRYVGGFVGHNSGNVTESFWDTGTSHMEESGGGTGLIKSEMQRKETFKKAGWDFEDTWYMKEYPDLQWSK